LIDRVVSGSPRIVFCAEHARVAPWIEGFEAEIPGAVVWSWHDRPDEPADYAVGWTPPDAFYASQPRLKALFNLGAGVDGILRSTALPPSLPVVRLEDAGMAPLMAEYVLQAAIRFARGLDVMEGERRAQRWTPQRAGQRADHPVGVMGAGELGVPVARMLAAHGFPVTLWSRRKRTIDGLACLGADELEAFLAGTRILVCVLPLTPDTEDIVDAGLLARLEPDAYLINVARGRHVVDADLLAAIASGHLAGATLDVFREEPLPASHPFWGEPRIVITPHCSALTQRRETIVQIGAKMRCLMRGETVTGVVDRARGY
jgi:glyoxylate/hydroxypyruvate reductase